MIKDEVFYGVQCDSCGKMLLGEYDIPLYYESPEYIEETAIDSDWKKLKGKHLYLYFVATEQINT